MRDGRSKPRCLLLLLIALPALLAAGCAHAPPGPAPVAESDAFKHLDPPANDRQSLVFGYLDMSDAPTDLGWMEFRQVSPQTATPYYQMRVHDGVFYMEKFPPGVFVMGEFGGERRGGQHLAYALPRTSPAVRVAFDQPGIHFVGAFKYRPVKEDGVRVGRFEVDKLAAPTEAEVLERILPFAQGTSWEARIRQAIAAGH